MSKTGAAAVLFRLGRDPAIDPARRGAARMLSFYQRAPIHLLGEAGWGEFDWMLSSLLRWAMLRLCGKRARYWSEVKTASPPSSGWTGSVFVVAVWGILIVALCRVLPVVPGALIG